MLFAQQQYKSHYKSIHQTKPQKVTATTRTGSLKMEFKDNRKLITINTDTEQQQLILMLLSWGFPNSPQQGVR